MYLVVPRHLHALILFGSFFFLLQVVHVPLIERADQLEPILKTSLDSNTLKQVMASVDNRTLRHVRAGGEDEQK